MGVGRCRTNCAAHFYWETFLILFCLVYVKTPHLILLPLQQNLWAVRRACVAPTAPSCVFESVKTRKSVPDRVVSPAELRAAMTLFVVITWWACHVICVSLSRVNKGFNLFICIRLLVFVSLDLFLLFSTTILPFFSLCVHFMFSADFPERRYSRFKKVTTGTHYNIKQSNMNPAFTGLFYLSVENFKVSELSFCEFKYLIIVSRVCKAASLKTAMHFDNYF